MRYEILYIIPAKFAENEVQPIIDQITGLIKEAGGEISKNENMGRKKLAYPINHIHHGYYILKEFELEPSAIDKLNRDLRLMQEILRHQIIKLERPFSTAEARPERKEKTEEEKTEKRIRPKEREEEEETEEREEEEEEEENKEEENEGEKEEKKEKEKVSIEDLDKKLDELLEINS